jgi:hypothetical protein
MILQNICNSLPIYTALRPWRCEPSATPLSKPQILQLSKLCVIPYCLSVLAHEFDNVIIDQGLNIFPPQEVQVVELCQWYPEGTNRILELFVQQQNILQTETASSVMCSYS